MLNLTNYAEHPSRPGFIVFRFYHQNRADYFEELLKEKAVWYDRDVAQEPRAEFLFGIKRADHDQVMKLNYLVSAKFRRKTIPYWYLRVVIYILALGAIALAIAGALKT